MIGISGVPGSGKTTLASAVVARINDMVDKGSGAPHQTFAAIVPMDGYHLYRSQLASMPDAANAIHRRGAAFTYDAGRWHQLVKDLSLQGSQPVFAPSFDHAEKDPVENDIAITRETRVVVLEGLYLSLSREPWSSAARLMDELWFVDGDEKTFQSRLIKRHVASGIVPDLDAARHRVTSTDWLNAEDIMSHRLPVQEHLFLSNLAQPSG